MTTLAHLTARTDRTVDDHLDMSELVPIIDGPQPQGDVIVIPADWSDATGGTATDVPPAGLTLVSGQHDHVLVADPDTVTVRLRPSGDPLAVAIVDATAPCWMLHPEHGAAGIAPGRWVVRRQREAADVERQVAD